MLGEVRDNPRVYIGYCPRCFSSDLRRYDIYCRVEKSPRYRCGKCGRTTAYPYYKETRRYGAIVDGKKYDLLREMRTDGKTFREIGAVVGLSRQRVHQILTRAFYMECFIWIREEIMANEGYTLDIVRVKGCAGAPWAMRMTIEGKSRYRCYHYKKEAVAGMYEWEGLPTWALGREFNHNFDSAERLGIKEVIL